MGVFQIIEGKVKAILFGNNGSEDAKLRVDSEGALHVNTKPVAEQTPFFYENTLTPGVEVLVDFGGVKKDMWVTSSKDFNIRVNSPSAPLVQFAAGYWEWEGEYVSKIYISSAEASEVQVYAGGW